MPSPEGFLTTMFTIKALAAGILDIMADFTLSARGETVALRPIKSIGLTFRRGILSYDGLPSQYHFDI